MSILFAHPTPISEPVIAAVRAVESHDVGAGGPNYHGLANCRDRGADLCATVFRRASEDRDAAARELAVALAQAGSGAGGVTDAPADIVRLRALTGASSGVHTCRVGTRLSVL